MKLRLLAGFVAGMLMVPSAAHAMDCCKDGKCECCKKDEQSPSPAPQGDHHQH